MSAIDSEYYRTRNVAERDLAKAAHIPQVAAVHEWLAQRYEALAVKASREAAMPLHELYYFQINRKPA